MDNHSSVNKVPVSSNSHDGESDTGSIVHKDGNSSQRDWFPTFMVLIVITTVLLAAGNVIQLIPHLYRNFYVAVITGYSVATVLAAIATIIVIRVLVKVFNRESIEKP